MGKLGLESIVVRSHMPVATEIEGEIAMISFEQGKYFVLDSVASCVWTLLEERRSVRGLVEELVKQFEIDKETCTRDTLGFLEELREKKLLEVE